MPYIIRATYDLLTIYMLLILLRWLGPWLQLELDVGRLRYIGRVVDPLVGRIRAVLPSLGPMDFSPIVALFAVYLVRTVVFGLMVGATRG